jgi:hypothetical protein
LKNPPQVPAKLHHLHRPDSDSRIQVLQGDDQEDVIQSSIDALHHALSALRQRLVSETNDSRMDPAAIAVIADSMSRTAQAITNVKAAQRT